MANDIQDFFKSVPPVTRTLVLVAIAMFIAQSLQIISLTRMVNYWPYVYRKFEIWRPFTAFLASFGDPLKQAFDVYALYTYSRKLEEEKFFISTADYVFFLSFICTVILTINTLTGGVLYLPAFTLAMVYTWVQDNVDNTVTFYFLRMKACYLPFLMILISLLLEGTPGALVVGSGYVAGHLYLFLDSIWPIANGGQRIIRVPNALRSLIPGRPQTSGVKSFGTPYRRGNAAAGGPAGGAASSGMSTATAARSVFGTRFQGQGRRLGD